jgi:D-threo-aldose 1-dehydrogenase
VAERIGLGTAALGGLFQPVSDDEALATIDRAWERGIRFFDTAPLYGHGLAERRLGRALSARPRDEFVLATKAGRLLRADAPPDPGQSFWQGAPPLNPVFDFSEEGALRSLEESLERLGLDRVDIVHVHDPDEHLEEALDGAYRALDRLRREGAIRALGAGMNHVEPLLRLARGAEFDCFLVAGRFTLLDRSALPELLPLCLERGIDVIAGGVLNSGILAGGTTFDYAPAPPALVDRARRLEELCERHGVPLLAAALQFPLSHPAVKTVLVGARSVAELDESLDALSVPIPADLWAELGA